jgi:hypothetical protein
VRRLVVRWSQGIEHLVWRRPTYRNPLLRLSFGMLCLTTGALVGLIEGARTGASRWIFAVLLLLCVAYFVALGLVCAWATGRQPRRHAVGLGRHSRNPKRVN